MPVSTPAAPARDPCLRSRLRARRVRAVPVVAAVAIAAGCGSTSGSAHRATLDASAVSRPLTAAATCASVYPSPGSQDASPLTQVSVRDVEPSALSSTTVTVTGASTGVHAGRWVTDSDQLGASFYPTAPFAAGETVTVSIGAPICGAAGDSASFSVALPPGAPAAVTTAIATRRASTKKAVKVTQAAAVYASLPTLTIPKLSVKVPADFGGSYLFETPRGGSIPDGLEIMNGDGQPVWYEQLPKGTVAADLTAQTYEGHRVLTWWQGGLNAKGQTVGEYVIMNSHYQVIRTVEPADGYASDEHEFLISPSGTTAWLVGSQVVGANLTGLGGPENGPVVEEVAQEIDLATGNMLFEWNSLAHVPVTASYHGYGPSIDYDYFHMNAIDPLANGTVVISARNTHAVYAVSASTGKILWELGGRHSSFAMSRGANFALQHDARMHGADMISIFDDEDASPHYAPARAILLHLDFATHRATLVRALTHDGLKVPWQGNEQLLTNGDTVVGWGSGSATSVYGPTGRLLFDATFAAPINSYRAYLLPWSGTPATPPALTVRTDHGRVHAFASWNGSTQTRGWEVLGGSTSSSLRRLATVARTGFQTVISLPAGTRYAEAIALGDAGHVLATSAVVRTAPAT